MSGWWQMTHSVRLLGCCPSVLVQLGSHTFLYDLWRCSYAESPVSLVHRSAAVCGRTARGFSLTQLVLWLVAPAARRDSPQKHRSLDCLGGLALMVV